MGNKLRVGLQERAQSTDVIPVRMCHDHVADRQIRDLAQSVQRRSGMCWRGARVDGDDTVVCTHERKVAEIKSLRDIDPRGELYQPRLGEVKPVLQGEPGVGDEGRQLGVE